MFLYMWENWGKPFSKVYKICDKEQYNKWWDAYKDHYSRRDIYEAMRNIAYAVNEDHYEEKYISKDPGKFLQGGMIERGLSYDILWSYEMEYPGYNDPTSQYYDNNYDYLSLKQ